MSQPPGDGRTSKRLTPDAINPAHLPEDTIIPTLATLQAALRAASPRFDPPATPWPALAIHGGISLLWVLLFARAFVLNGPFAWSIGLAYVGYDTALLAFVFWKTLDLARTRPPAPVAEPGRASVTLGVLVAAHNEASVLPLTLKALFDQTEPPDLIVVADDGSTDGTADLLARAFELTPPEPGTLGAPGPVRPSLRWLRLPQGGKPQALNQAILQVDTDLVLTVDADTLLEPDAIAAMRRAFADDPHLVAATGILSPVCARTLGGRVYQWFQTYEYVRNFLSRYAWMRMDSLLLISGAFAAFRRRPVMAVGGFDPACLVEDYELIHRLRRWSVTHGLGWTTAVVGGSRAVTDAPGGTAAFLRQRRRWFGGFLQTQLWYRDMVGSRAYGRLGLFMLPVKAADTMQPIYGLTAAALLIGYLADGRFALVNPASGVIGLKILVDLAFHLWSIHLYRRWVGSATPVGYASGLLASLVEPFTFQILRHLGAALGWVVFLTGGSTWGVQTRSGLTARPAEPAR